MLKFIPYEERITAYKGVRPDRTPMHGYHKPFRAGATYRWLAGEKHIARSDKPMLCARGYHCSKKLVDAARHCSSRFYEVEVWGWVDTGIGKMACENMKFIRELSKKEVKERCLSEERGGYYYALFISRKPCNASRKNAIENGHGYYYAVNVDKCPRDDTRAAAITEGKGHALWYAVNVDRCSREDTYKAASRQGQGHLYTSHFQTSYFKE